MVDQTKQLTRWLVLFFLGNLLLAWLIAFRYFPKHTWYAFDFLSTIQKFNLVIFLVCSFVSHFFLIIFLPLLVLLPLAYLRCPKKYLAFFSTLYVTSALGFLLIDTIVFDYYHFHLNWFFLRVALTMDHGTFFYISKREVFTVVVLMLILLAFEIIFARQLWRYLEYKNISLKRYNYVGGYIFISFFVAYVSILYLKETYVQRIFLEEARFLPGYIDLISLILPTPMRIGERIPLQSDQANNKLNYPRQSLAFKTDDESLNLVIMVVDSWRYDTFNQETTPNIYEVSKKSWVFRNHTSGGNATGPGMFSLFYSLPPTYWMSTLLQHRSPLLLDELQNSYAFNVFASAQLFSPQLNRTVFQHVKNLRVEEQPGNTPTARDKIITDKFKHWVTTVNSKPFAAVLFYNSPHSYCETEDNGPYFPNTDCNRVIQQNGIEILNRYKNSVYFVDQQVKQVFAFLSQKNLLQKTVVVITSDHGEEFDDNHLGYRGHASNYTKYQLHVPLVVYWPKQIPNVFTHMTSHYDIVPTLMRRFLHCKNHVEDYSVGKDLLDKSDRYPLVAGSYIDFGILEANQVTRFNSTGSYRIENLKGEVSPALTIQMASMRRGLLAVRDYYQ